MAKWQLAMCWHICGINCLASLYLWKTSRTTFTTQTLIGISYCKPFTYPSLSTTAENFFFLLSCVARVDERSFFSIAFYSSRFNSSSLCQTPSRSAISPTPDKLPPPPSLPTTGELGWPSSLLYGVRHLLVKIRRLTAICGTTRELTRLSLLIHESDIYTCRRVKMHESRKASFTLCVTRTGFFFTFFLNRFFFPGLVISFTSCPICLKLSVQILNRSCSWHFRTDELLKLSTFIRLTTKSFNEF